VGKDLYPAPRREVSYPLKKMDYPQYSPGGNNISGKRNSLEAVRIQMHAKRQDEEAEINLAEYEKTMLREMEKAQKKMTGNKKFIDVSKNTSPTWRRTSRAHHNDIKWRDDEMRAPRATRYSPNYEPV
jgi:recombinational DNA repair ATPase RecF